MKNAWLAAALLALGSATGWAQDYPAKPVRMVVGFPTAEEAGLPGYVVTTWYGIFAPAGTD